jgi:metallo-beta-lactamase family protein
MKLSFYGAAGTVTGSKYLLQNGGGQILVDCGLFQGLKKLRQRNWEEPPFDVASLDAIVITHAHIDHTGYLPVLFKKGYRGPVYCTSGTADLCGILLPDSGHLQEEEARFLAKHKYSRHDPPLPLYTRADAEAFLPQLQPVEFDTDVDLGHGLTFRYSRAGHILGSAWACFQQDGFRIVFSGDVGRQTDVIMKPPVPIEHADVLICESTYGNRRHSDANPAEELRDVIKRTAARGGVLVIPAFAVGRTQTLLHLISELDKAGEIPKVPVYLNSPMAIDATNIYCDHAGEHKLNRPMCGEMFAIADFVRSEQASRALNTTDGPAIIIAGSGMATGGRVVHHLRTLLPDPNNTVLLAGFQAPGTRGEALRSRAESVKIFGEYIPVRAEIKQLHAMSAHGDHVEIVKWLKQGNAKPKRVFLTHGEPVAANSMRSHFDREFGWDADIPEHKDTVTLG